jgi:hypothetical protein
MNNEEILLMRWINDYEISDCREPHEFIYGHTGDLFEIDDSGFASEIIGKFEIFYVDIRLAMNKGVALYKVFDSHSAELVEYHDRLFQPLSYDFNDSILTALDEDILDHNLLIINNIQLLPKFRGKNLGLVILRDMIDRFSAGVSIVAINPFPVQCEPVTEENAKWRDSMGLSHFQSDEEIAKIKLQDYFRKLGFISLKGTSIMVASTT